MWWRILSLSFLLIPRGGSSWSRIPTQAYIHVSNTHAPLIITPLFMSKGVIPEDNVPQKNEAVGRFFNNIFDGESTELQEDFDQTKPSVVSRIFTQIFDKESKEEKKDGLEKYKDNDKEVGFFRSIVNRLPGRKDDNESKRKFRSSRQERKELKRQKVIDDNDDSGFFDPTKLVGNAFGSIENTVLNLRKQIEEVRSSEILDDTNGFLLNPEEEKERIKEMRIQIIAKRKKDEEDQRIRQRQAELQAKADEEKRREAQVRATAKRQELKANEKLQKEQLELNRKVMEAAGKSRADFPFGRAATIPEKSFQRDQPISDQQKEKRKQMNPQSVPQQFFSWSEADNDNSTTTNSSSSFSFPNPLGAVQRLFSSVWNSTFGGEKETEEEWVVVFPKTRLDPGEVVPVNVGGIDLLVVASVDGKKLYCIANSCPHLGTPLETGPLVRRPVEGAIKSDSPDGCEDCIVCPLHQTTFALESGEVRGEWCPYPPVLGALMGAVKKKSPVAVFDIRTRGKNVEVKINSSLDDMGKKRKVDNDSIKS